MRTYPVPTALVPELGHRSVLLASVRVAAHSADSSPEARAWAWRILDAQRDQTARTLVAAGADPDCDYYGILDPDFDQPLVVALVQVDPQAGEGEYLRRWNGSGWDVVPTDQEPAGMPYIAVQNTGLLADLISCTPRSPMLLRPGIPRAQYRGGTLVAAVGDSGDGKYFAVVDDFDSTAVLNLLYVQPGPVVYSRQNGQWVSDPEMASRLTGVDPPQVVSIADADSESVISQVDQSDQQNPVEDEDDQPLTAAAPWDESKYKRDQSGRFSSKNGSNQDAQRQAALNLRGDQLANYIANGGPLPSGVEAPKAKKGRRGGGGSGRKSAAKKVAKKAATHGQSATGGRKSTGSSGRSGGSASSGGSTAARAAATRAKAQAAAERAKQVKAKQEIAATNASIKTQWAREDAAAKDRDAKYDIARAKADLAESQRRSQADASFRKRWNDIVAQVSANLDPDAAKAQQDQLESEAKAEQERRTQFDQNALLEAKAEKIRRMERKATTDAQRAVISAQMAAGTAKPLPKGQGRTAKTSFVAGANPPAHSAMPRNLHGYWVRGEGAAKIRWGVSGDFNRCRKHLAKYLNPAQVSGACANLHKVATGTWPGKNRGHGVSASASSIDETDEIEGPTHAGVALVARDTGRVLMLQRGMDQDDDASGLWEFPGGGMEDGEHPYEAAKREWQEETGIEFPSDVQHVGDWSSPNGIYQGYVVAVPSESDIEINPEFASRAIINPDNADGDYTETVAWWDPQHAQENPALRPECGTSDWDLISKASADQMAS